FFSLSSSSPYPFFSPSPDPSLLPSYLLPSPSISTRSPLPSPSPPPRLASSVTSRLLTTSQSKKTASSLMTTLLPQSFSSDLKLFVGNLPFNVDSAQVAQLFESAGNVEMAEVFYDKPLKLRQGEAEVLALESLFGEQGKVVEARVIYDRDSGSSKGFGFVTYNSAQEAQNAIRTLDGADLDRRQIRVSEAEARPPRRQF
uniref:RRM domain-containing protein n=1 Tax=Brassica oleracea var. oleracea TaxID=109376 RepID=A0A0D3EEY8_BRAOL